MSVKLPNIVHKQAEIQSPKKEKQHEESPEPVLSENEGAQEYAQNEDFEQFEASRSGPAPENLTALKAQSDPHSDNLQVDVVLKNDSYAGSERSARQNREQLEQLLSQKLKTAANLRQGVEDRKKEIKSIGDQIDKDLNKSLLKAAKTNNVNIRDIFSSTPKTNNQNLNHLNQELKQTRFAIKKIKNDIQKAHDGFSDPLAQMNQDRGQQFKVKIKVTENQIKTIEHEKDMLEVEISRGGRQFNEEEEKQRAEDISKMTLQLHQLLISLKEEKMKLYHLEKQDILFMEKIKFFQERQGHIGLKKAKNTTRDKGKLEQQMRQLISEINETMEERNKTETDKKQQTRQLTQEIASLQTKNWQIVSKLRDIDAFLLQYYEKKSRKKEIKTIDVMEKSVSGKIETQSIASDNLNKSKFSDNDKNATINSAPLAEKKKNYEFGMKQPSENEVNFNDDFLGQKLLVKRLTIKCHKAQLLTLKARYINSFDNQMDGFKMGLKNLPEGTQTMQIQLKKDEVINFIHTGFTERGQIAYFHVVTSEGKEMKWGVLDNIVKNEQKHIKRYESGLFKAKLTLQQNEDDQMKSYFVSGLTFMTTYMSPK